MKTEDIKNVVENSKEIMNKMLLEKNYCEVKFSNIYSDFIKAQKEFKPVLLNRTNPFHKSRYADLGSHLDSVMTALNNNNFSLIQKTHDCESGVCVETILYHESGEQISGGMLRVPVVKNDPQGHGAALTYARRFSLGSLLSLYGEEDNDGNEHVQEKQNYSKPVNKPPLQQKIDDMKQAQAKNIILDGERACSKGKENFLSWYKTLSESERKLIADKMDHFKSKCKEADDINQDIGE